MKPRPRVLAAFITAILAASSLPVGATDLSLTPLVVDVLWPPVVAHGSEDQRHLVYELRLANPTPAAIDLAKVEVIDPRSDRTLLEAAPAELARRFSIGGRRGAEANGLAVGQFGILFLHVPLAAGSGVPGAIIHRVTGVLRPDRAFTITTGATPVIDRAPIALGPPLAGAGYVAADGCCDTIRHVRALLPLDGRFALAQRFAIDWEQIDSEKRVGTGDLAKVESYTIFGQDAIAVADGTVIAARNDLPEQVPGKLPDGLPIDQADGNFIVLDIGGGAFALYAHLRQGSVMVAAGDRVRRGDRLGKVGNTGNSSAPHLHFHLMDGPEPLASNGLPYVINRFTVTAIDREGTADFDKAEATGTPLSLTPVTPTVRNQNMLPMDLTVVDFSR